MFGSKYYLESKETAERRKALNVDCAVTLLLILVQVLGSTCVFPVRSTNENIHSDSRDTVN